MMQQGLLAERQLSCFSLRDCLMAVGAPND
jgi:hypothetical protein